MLLRGILLQTFLDIVASFVLTTVESQMVSVYPPSIGAQRGEQNVVISCNITGVLVANQYIVWVYYPTWQATGYQIFSSYNNVTNDPINFAVSPFTKFGDTYFIDLVIKTVKPELATPYRCAISQPIGNPGNNSHVIALDPTECPSNGAIEYNEGTEADISCSVNYYDSTLTFAPMVMWYRDGQPIPGVEVIDESPTRRRARLTKNVTLADDNQAFVCIVDFVDSNPDYTDNCTTVFHVMHSVSEISFYPPSSAEAQADVAVGETINCTANGRPAPTIEWPKFAFLRYDEAGNLLSEFRELLVTEAMRSWEQPITLYCRANNTIDNGETFAYVEGNYTFNVIGAETNVTSGGTEDPFIFSTDLTTASIVSSTVDSTTDNPCYPSPCRNGATCIENGHNFSCICVSGFTGQNCSVEINECESSPCYPFGKCTDLIGDYNCSCNPGYEPLPNNTKTCTETNFCAMEIQPCFNGGTCINQNALSRYYCLCPVLDGKQYVGLLCETELITKPIVDGGISPSSGIIAGGANVTIRGQGMNVFEPLGAYLVDTTPSPMPSLYAYAIPNLTLSDSITVRVPPAEHAYVDRNLLMIVEYTGPINVTTDKENLRFKYTGNPVIETIEPKEILVLGGVHLTVSGSNMDTVQNPMMDITTFVVNKTTPHSETNYSRESCSLKNTSAITCLVPHGIVPSAFLNNTMPAGKGFHGVVHLESSFRHKTGSRRRKRAPVANLTDEAGSTFEMYLGFIFDEYPTYNNISKSLPHVTLTLVSPQVSFNPGSSVDFVSNKMETISLKGSGFTYGCSMGDYQVSVSNAPCTVTSLTDNELQCQPPKEEPTINDSSSFCVSASDPHPVKVFIGGETHLGCCLSYTTDYTDIIIAVTVSCVVVVAIIILVAILVYKHQRKSQESELTILTFLRKKLFNKGDTLQRSVKRDNIFVNSDAPPELVEEAIEHAVNANRRPTDERQPKEETNSKTPVDDYLVAYDEDVVSTRNRSNVGVEIVPTRRYPTGTRNAALTEDDYLQPIDGQMMFNSNDGISDNRGDCSGRTREKYAHVDDIGELSIEDDGTRPISEQNPDYLILFDTEDTRPINEPDIDYLILHDTEGSRPLSERDPAYLILYDTEIDNANETPV